MRPRVLLVEDHTLVRSGVRSLLESSREVDVVGEADSGRTAIDAVRDLKPNVVLMDVAMADLNGIDATRTITRDFPEVRVLMLSMHADEQYIFEALKAGARGYVLKSAAVKELIAGIRAAAAGDTYVSPSLSNLVVSDYARRAKGDFAAGSLDRLTAREREVLQLIVEGHSSAKVAQMLYISVRTVESHRQNVMDKLNIHSIAGLTRFALKHRLSTLQ